MVTYADQEGTAVGLVFEELTIMYDYLGKYNCKHCPPSPRASKGTPGTPTLLIEANCVEFSIST